MTPSQASKLMAQWGEMLSGASEQLEGLAQRQDSQDALEANYTRLDAELKRVVAETEAARVAQKAQLEYYATETRQLSEDRRQALADRETIAERSRHAVEAHSFEVVQQLEAKRDVLKAEIEAKVVLRNSLAKNLADMRAVIADMAKR
jgi:hypothetical protein